MDFSAAWLSEWCGLLMDINGFLKFIPCHCPITDALNEAEPPARPMGDNMHPLPPRPPNSKLPNAPPPAPKVVLQMSELFQVFFFVVVFFFIFDSKRWLEVLEDFELFVMLVAVLRWGRFVSKAGSVHGRQRNLKEPARPKGGQRPAAQSERAREPTRSIRQTQWRRMREPTRSSRQRNLKELTRSSGQTQWRRMREPTRSSRQRNLKELTRSSGQTQWRRMREPTRSSRQRNLKELTRSSGQTQWHRH